jgi:hypothetical protein
LNNLQEIGIVDQANLVFVHESEYFLFDGFREGQNFVNALGELGETEETVFVGVESVKCFFVSDLFVDEGCSYLLRDFVCSFIGESFLLAWEKLLC